VKVGKLAKIRQMVQNCYPLSPYLTQDDLASEKVLRKQNEILTGAHRKNKNADTNPDTENEQK